ncbi:MAG: DNA polymerase III subunit alpha [Candidatus Lambdaproteobacteria bacterium RIFOXYD1_FULL_56_27]|nr:MAG: DNA polymerase III subunit alpha [Candidatus Lambdaproteobacteria bacterium RIFOXYC1_FULL_56_13]OGH07323.1 MAG: DNA polymerase III subunit alpha [Candidatus Lambdaproteobacteria bacterium RIFOXYD1_FULL_56_27]
MSSQFVHLHFHTHYSLLDGAIKVKGLGKTLSALGFTASAITDHGNLHGAIEFHHELKKAGVKPIIGMEAYIAKGNRFERNYPKPGPNAYHAVLLATNYQGYINLGKMASLGFSEGKYYGKPRIDHELLEKFNSGIICLSACLQGELANRLRAGEVEEAYKVAKWYGQVFAGRYYVELQANGLADQNKVNPQLIQLAQDLSLPLVGTNDCHYPNRDLAEAHYILQLMGWQRKVTDPGVKELETKELYLKSPEEMAQAFAALPPEALANTVKIAESCELDLTNKKYYLPDYPLSRAKTLEEELVLFAKEGLVVRLEQAAKLYKWSAEEQQRQGRIYADRLDYETQVINSMGFPGYFLIVADFINWAKANGVPVGPGRGSGAGSLVAYAMRITDIDPIKYDLLFERFLNPERVSMPDFDIDFEVEGRERVIEYVRQKYGQKNVCQIAAIGSLLAKGALRGVARVLDIPYAEADKIAKLIPEELGITLEQAMEKEPELKRMAESGTELEKKLIQTALALEGLNNNLSTHAAGVIIMNSDITDVMPTCTPAKGDDLQSMYSMKYIEDQGAVKFDFLGLRNLTVIDKAVQLINAQRPQGQQLDIAAIEMDDKKTFALLGKGDTTGVFQLESQGMKELIKRLKPTNFEEIIALVALYRPGPLGSGMVENFVERKHGRQKVIYTHPLMAGVLRETYGVMVYQEQVMRVVQVLGGFTLGQSDMLRRAIGKKIAEILAEQRQIFIDGCKANPEFVSGCGAKVPDAVAGEIFDLIDYFAGYGFNKSHSAAYALVSYQTAWLKANYKVEFMAALLTSEISKPDSIVKLITECREMGIEVLAPDINESELVFTTHQGRIRFGLSAIKGVGSAAMESIFAARKNAGKFADLAQVFSNIDASKLNSRVMEALVKSGVFDSLMPNRRMMYEGIESCLGLAASEKSMKIEDQTSLFDLLDAKELDKCKARLEFKEVLDWKPKEKLRFEYEALGFFISGHPLDPYAQEIARFVTLTPSWALRDEEKTFKPKSQMRLLGVLQSKVVKMTRKNEKMAVLKLEDQYGSYEAVVFPAAFEQLAEAIEPGEPVLVSGRYNGTSLATEKITPLPKLREETAVELTLKLPQGTGLEQINRLKVLVFGASGRCRVYAKVFTNEGLGVRLDLGASVRASEAFLDQISETLPGIGFEFKLEYRPEEPGELKKSS